MKFYDYWAETLHEKFPKLKNLLCWLGLHSWGYMGEINCWPAGYRNLWFCSRCPAEKWLKEIFK